MGDEVVELSKRENVNLDGMDNEVLIDILKVSELVTFHLNEVNEALFVLILVVIIFVIYLFHVG